MSRWLIRVCVGLAVVVCVPSVARGQSETVEYYGTDEVGSIRIIYDASGNVLARQDYGPFGAQLLPWTALPQENFGGNTTDGESDQLYFRARQYEVRTGRFAQVDPIYAGLFEPQQWNRYTYVANNPATLADPTGELIQQCNRVVVGDVSHYACDSFGNVPPRVWNNPDGFVGGARTTPTVPLPPQNPNPPPPNPPPPNPPPPNPPPPNPPPPKPTPRIPRWLPQVCGGGGFGYGAVNIHLAKKVGAESVGLIEYDSQEGGSHGGLVGLELGPTVTGVESLRTWSDWKSHTGPIGIGGGTFSAASRQFGKRILPSTVDAGGFANWMDSQLSIGAYFGGEVFGGGGYISLSWNGCK